MTTEEKRMILCIISDLLTGNHLLGRPRSEEYRKLMKEFCIAAEKVDTDEMLTDREKELLKEAATNFYRGAKDMCEQLGISEKVLEIIS